MCASASKSTTCVVLKCNNNFTFFGCSSSSPSLCRRCCCCCWCASSSSYTYSYNALELLVSLFYAARQDRWSLLKSVFSLLISYNLIFNSCFFIHTARSQQHEMKKNQERERDAASADYYFSMCVRDAFSRPFKFTTNPHDLHLSVAPAICVYNKRINFLHLNHHFTTFLCVRRATWERRIVPGDLPLFFTSAFSSLCSRAAAASRRSGLSN